MEDGRGMMNEGRRKMDDRCGTMNEKRTNKIRTVRDLKVYRKAFDNAMEIFELSKLFRYSEVNCLGSRNVILKNY